MNERERFERFIGKNVTIFLKNSFRYMGKLMSVGESFLTLDDRKKGLMEISVDQVAMIEINGGAGGHHVRR